MYAFVSSSLISNGFKSFGLRALRDCAATSNSSLVSPYVVHRKNSLQSPAASKKAFISSCTTNRLSTLAISFSLLGGSTTAMSTFKSISPTPSVNHTTTIHHHLNSFKPTSLALISPVIASSNPLSTANSTSRLPASPTSERSPRSITSDVSRPSYSVSIRDRISFYSGEFLMWNPSAKVIALLAFTLTSMFLGSFLYRFADPKGEEAAFPFWHSVRAIANPLEDDWQKNSLRATSIFLAAFGMVVFAILVGMVTETVASAVENVDGDKSRVVLSDHVVVCGWGSHVAQMLKDVGNVSSNLKVVVLAPPGNKDRMIDQMRSTFSDEQRKKMRVFYRSGAPEIAEDLNRVGAARAKKILLVNPRDSNTLDSDRIILSHALSLRQNLPTFKGDVIAELNNVRDEGIVRSILAKSKARSVETVNTEPLLLRFMAQAIRQPGLADVVALLMGDNASWVFHVAPAKESAPHLVGMNFSDLRPTSIPGSILCGFVNENGQVFIENGHSYGAAGETVQPSSKLLVLGVSKSMRNVNMEKSLSTFEMTAPMTALLHRNELSGTVKKVRKESINYLVLGWREGMEHMLEELDSMLPSGSKISIVDLDVPDRLPGSLKNIDLTLVKKRADQYETIEELMVNGRTKQWDHVVVLGSAIGESVDDSKTLATVIYVNDVISKLPGSSKQTMVTVEFVSEPVAEMAKDEGNVGNAILPQNLSAKIAAQTIRDSHLNAVWQELLSQRGREVYLRPVSKYGDVAGQRASFATMADNMSKSNDDILIGYIPRFIPKVTINPRDGERHTTRVWHEDDLLVVLSKN